MQTTQCSNRALPWLTTLLALGLPMAAQAQYAYDITPIAGTPLGLNNQGQAVGYLYSTQKQQYRAFEYSNGQVTDLFPNDANEAAATGINDNGQICGNSGASGPFVYDSKMGTTHIPKTAKGDHANAINQKGDVAGDTSFGSTIAYTYASSTGNFQYIGKFGGSTIASAINNNGQVAGDFVTGGQVHAFLYSSGSGLQDIGTLTGDTTSQASGINDSGDVIGYSDSFTTPTHAFLYHNGTMQDVGALYGNFTSYADGINNAGDVVGEAGNTGFLYHNGQALYLNNLVDPMLGWNIRTATAINDQGQIIGYGNRGGFIMTPHIAATPAPGSALTFWVGTAVFLLAARRRKQAR